MRSSVLLCRLLIMVTVAHRSMSDRDSSRVTLPQGILLGIKQLSGKGTNFWSYRGIPYAKPPVDEYRFKDPIPHEGWDKEFMADSYGPSCPQWDLSKIVIGNEDCLTLNIFTPKLPNRDPPRYTTFQEFMLTFQRPLPNESKDEYLPVIFFVHGGSFRDGGSSYYGPAKLLDGADIVLVSINYRLGSLGFLCTEDDKSPGNYGLMDIVLALTWVKDNIHHFGGDPKRVTLVGSSAGAAAVSLVYISPLARGLFWAAIIQSGSSLSDWSVANNPKKYATRMATSLDCDHPANSSDIVTCLRKFNSSAIIEAQQRLLKHDSLAIKAAAVVDGGNRFPAFLPDNPEVMLTNGNFSQVPLITGVNTDEGILFVFDLFRKNRKRICRDPHYFEEFLLPAAMESVTDNPLSDERMLNYKTSYFHEVNCTDLNAVITPFSDMVSDFMFFSGNDRMAKLVSKFAPVFVYVFEYRGMLSWTGLSYPLAMELGLDMTALTTSVAHADELFYLFSLVPYPFLWPDDQRVQDVIVQLWKTFATNRDPNPANEDNKMDLDHWERFEPETMAYYRIAPVPRNATYYRTGRLATYDHYNKTII